MPQNLTHDSAKQSASDQKKAILTKKREDALRANLKKRKDQTNARKDETTKE